jgi:hypothetical protein
LHQGATGIVEDAVLARLRREHIRVGYDRVPFHARIKPDPLPVTRFLDAFPHRSGWLTQPLVGKLLVFDAQLLDNVIVLSTIFRISDVWR